MQLNKDYELSQRLRGEISALSYQCWYSAKRTLVYLDAGARYVEGWVVTTDGLVVEHGWCQAGGRIIDSALPVAELTYFAGLCFDTLQLEILDRDPTRLSPGSSMVGAATRALSMSQHSRRHVTLPG